MSSRLRKDGGKRGKPVRELKSRIHLFCEGEKTEPEYFREFRRLHGRGEVVITIKAGRGEPDALSREAVKFYRGNKRPGDRVWAVFDRDNHEKYHEAMVRCEEQGVEVACSNPCFELWLLLHDRDYDKPNDPKTLKKEVVALRKRKTLPQLVAEVEAAEGRAEALSERREEERRPDGNPSTGVGRLTRALRGL